MILHIMGAGLIILAGGLLAKSKTAMLKVHIETLSSLITSLQIMRSEINVNLTPIGEIITDLSESADPRCHQLFSKTADLLTVHGAPYFSHCWRAGIAQYSDILTEREQNALLALGEILGKYDVADECNAIERCILELNAGYESSKLRYASDARLYAGMYLTIGCILAIILL